MHKYRGLFLAGGLLALFLSISPALWAQDPTLEPPSPTIELPTVEPPTAEPSTLEPPTVEPPTLESPTLEPPTLELATPTELPSMTATFTETLLPSATNTETLTETPTISGTATSIETLTPTFTPTISFSPTASSTVEPEPTPMLPFTLTPSFDEQRQMLMSLSVGTEIGAAYAIIASGDFEGLRQAIQYSDSHPNQFYPIYLEAGYYDATETLVVRGNTAIYGRGIGVTYIRQITNSGTGPGRRMNGLFTLPGAALTLDNLTVMNGSTNGLGGGVWVQGSTAILTVTNSHFNTNAASAGGGGISVSNGRAVVHNSSFTGNNTRNTANQWGGAIQNHSTMTSPVAVAVTCTVFQSNYASNAGGAVANRNNTGLMTISTSNFLNNNATASSAVNKHAYSLVTLTASVDAQHNWFNPAVAPLLNNLGVNTSNQLDEPIDSMVCPQEPPEPIPVTPSIWYVTCYNLTGPLNVRAGSTTGSQLLGTIERGGELVRPNLQEFTDGNIVRVPIYWPLGQTQTIGYIAIRDNGLGDGEYLTQQRDPACPAASPTPSPSLTPMPTATFDPSFPTHSPGRFGENVPTILSVFNNQPPAVMGVLGIHPTGQLDVVPKDTEYCIDSSVETQLGNCDPPGSPLGIPVYAPVSGCGWRDLANVIILIVNCEGQGTYPNGRREIALTHLDPSTIQQLPVANFDPPIAITAGQLLGYMCRDGNKSNCAINNSAIPTHLAISVRFYVFTTVGQFTAATNSEVLGFNATPSCLFDAWLASAGLPTSNPNPVHACPL